MNKALRAVDDMRRTEVGTLNRFAKAERGLTSLTHVVHDGLEALQKLVVNQRHATIQRYYQLSSEITDLLSMSSLVPVLLARTVEFNCVLAHTSDLRDALMDAVHGRLNTFIIPRAQMFYAMRSIASELSRIHYSLRLATRSLGDTYQLTDFVVSRMGRDIFITIKFPVTPVRHALTLYDVVTYPVLLPDNSDHVTLLDSDVKAIALSHVADYHMEFSTRPLIHNRLLHLPSESETLRNSDELTCIYALFRNTIGRIRELCSFILLPHSLQPSVLRLDASNVLFTNVTNITRTCTDSAYDAQLPPCRQCIYHLPCSCNFHTRQHLCHQHCMTAVLIRITDQMNQ